MSKHKPPPGDKGSGSARDKLRAQRELQARRSREQRLILIIAGVLVLVLIGGGIGLQLWRTHRSHPTAAPSVATVGELNRKVEPENGKPLLLGEPKAAVTVTLYEDFHCPHCAEFEEQFGKTLTDNEVAGKIKIELYPMSFIDDGSARAANAMACAASAGFPQTYYLGLFTNHTLQWNAEQLVNLAGVSGGSATSEFTSCVNDNHYKGWVDSINTAADSNGVTSTPTMFINGQPVNTQTLTVAALQQQLDQAAAK